MIVSLGSIKGAPGVTSWTVLLATAWPTAHAPERVVLEADPDGGALGARYGLGVEPGAVSLIAAARRATAGAVAIDHHGRALGDGLWVVPGPNGREQARSVWSSGAESLAGHVAADERLWFVDLGRLDLDGPTAPLVERSRLCVVVVSGRTEDLVRLPPAIERLAGAGIEAGVLVSGPTEYKAADVVDFAGTPHVWHVARVDDLPVVAAGATAGGRARRTWLWRSAIEVAARMADAVAASATASAVRMRGAS